MSLRDLANTVAAADTKESVDSTSSDFIHGVPAFFGDADGPLSICLTFRVGQADETLRHRGITRLIYELVRSSMPNPLADLEVAAHDGVDQLTTSFTVKGADDQQTIDQFNELVRNLVMLPTDRLDAVKASMLANPLPQTEMLAELQTLRFGLRGYGLLTGDELGLYDADAEKVDEWRRLWFTSGNAVASFSKAPPDGVSLSSLPAGGRKALPEPRPLEQPLPAWYPNQEGQTIATFLTPDNAAAWLMTTLVEQRLTDRLIDNDALAHELTVHGAQLGGGMMQTQIVVDHVATNAEAVRMAINAELFRVSVAEPSDAEIDALRAMRRRHSMMRRSGSLLTAYDHALRDLFDTPNYQNDDQSIEVSPADVSRSVRIMLPTGIWLIPRSAAPTDHRLLPISEISTRSVTGNTFMPIDGLIAARHGDRLEVAESGITLSTSTGSSATVLFADCVAMQVWPDGARTLWGDDGIRVLVHYGVWQGGEQILAFIDAKVDPWVALVMASPSGYVIPLAPATPNGRRR